MVKETTKISKADELFHFFIYFFIYCSIPDRMLLVATVKIFVFLVLNSQSQKPVLLKIQSSNIYTHFKVIAIII